MCDGLERFAAAVHVAGRFHEDRFLALHPERVPAFRMLPSESPLGREAIDDFEPNVMTRAVVFRPGITEADNQMNLRGVLLQNVAAKAELFFLLFFLRSGRRSWSGSRFAFFL